MSTLTIEQAAQLATEILTLQGHPDEPVVAPGCIRDLRSAGRLATPAPGRVEAAQVRDLFDCTKVLDTTRLSYVRVSITPLGPSGATDPLADQTQRQYAGWDFTNAVGAAAQHRLAGIEGVWPFSEEQLRQASLVQAFFLPSMKGFVDGSLIRRVTGYYLDLTSRRRWVHTRALAAGELDVVLPRTAPTFITYEHVWLTIPKGAVAATHITEHDRALAVLTPA